MSTSAFFFPLALCLCFLLLLCSFSLFLRCCWQKSETEWGPQALVQNQQTRELILESRHDFQRKLWRNNKLIKCVSLTYPELHRITSVSTVRHVLTIGAAKIHVISLVLSHLDYNSLLSGMPQQLIEKVPNCSARLIFKTSKCTRASQLLTKLHWLPIAQRIEYNVLN